MVLVELEIARKNPAKASIPALGSYSVALNRKKQRGWQNNRQYHFSKVQQLHKQPRVAPRFVSRLFDIKLPDQVAKINR